MDKDKMIKELDALIRYQNYLALQCEGKGDREGKLMHQDMRNGVVLAQIQLRRIWYDSSDTN